MQEVVKKLIRCTICNQVTPNFQAGEIALMKSLPGIEWSEDDLATAKEFLIKHSGHRMEELTIEEDSFVSETPFHEAIRVDYLTATRGRRRFFIRRTKPALEAPASYQIIPGTLKIEPVSLEIQKKDLRQQMNAERGFSPLLKAKIEIFIEYLRGEMAGVTPKEFLEEAGAVEAGETSLVAYGSLSETRWENILNRCRDNFTDGELRALKKFIDENRNPPDVLSIEIHRRISMIPVPDLKSAAAHRERIEVNVGEEAESEDLANAFSKKGRGS